MLRPAISLAVLGTIVTAAGHRAGRRAGCSGFSSLEGLLLGSILASTDGAAIFALLRGSTLRRRLARTLEAESGFNDPVAVLLVLGFIDWIQQPGYGIADMAWLFAARARGSAWRSGWRWGPPRFGRSGGSTWRPPASTRWPRSPLRRSPTAAPPPRRLGLPRRLSGRTGARRRPYPRQAHDHRLPRGPRVGRPDHALPDPRVARLPESARRRAGQRNPRRLGGRVRGPAARHRSSRPPSIASALRERLVLGWAGLRGAVPVVLATFPVISGVTHSLEFFNIVFFAVVISTIVQGTTFEPLAQSLGTTTRRARPAAAAGRDGNDPRARGRGGRVRGGRGRLDRRAAGPRPRAPARGAGQRDRARRRGDPAPRIDPGRGRGQAAHPGPQGGRVGVRSS